MTLVNNFNIQNCGMNGWRDAKNFINKHLLGFCQQLLAVGKGEGNIFRKWEDLASKIQRCVEKGKAPHPQLSYPCYD